MININLVIDHVYRKALSTVVIAIAPILRPISVAAIVAKLSVIITESDNKPDCCSSIESNRIRTRLG